MKIYPDSLPTMVILPAEVRLADEWAVGIGMGALGLGVVGQLTRLDVFAPTKLLFRLGVVGGGLSMLWNGVRAADRLFNSEWEQSRDRLADFLLLASSCLAVAAILVGGIGQSPLSRSIVRLGSLIDLGDLLYLCTRHLEDPEQVTAGQVALQFGLRLIFGLPSGRGAVLTFYPRGGEISSHPYPDGSFFKFQEADFVLSEQLGSGGHARVYLARHRTEGFEAAGKVSDEWYRDNIEEEIQVFKRLAERREHLSHLVRAYGFYRRADRRPVLVMERLSGERLEQRLMRGPLGVEEAVDLFLDYAKGLQEAHAAGILHLDPKPDSFQITTEGIGKVFDFSLAKFRDPQTGGWQSNYDWNGTPAYISPEMLCLGERRIIGPSADIYSWGMSLHEALTGRGLASFLGTGRAGASPDMGVRMVGWHLVGARLPSLWQARTGGWPKAMKGPLRELNQIVQEAIAKDRFKRFASFDEVIKSLEGWRSRWSQPRTYVDELRELF